MTTREFIEDDNLSRAWARAILPMVVRGGVHELAPLCVLCLYDDVPGVIGRVGTLFGEAGVNIAGMTVSRSRRGGKALMALTVDSVPSPELVERLRGEGFDDARVLELGPVAD